MGSSSSKNTATDSPLPPATSSSSSSSTAVVRRSRSTRSKVFQSSCLGSRDSDNEATQASEHQTKRNGVTGPCLSESKSGGRKTEWYGKVKVKKHDETCVDSNIELDDWDESTLSDTVARRGDASSRASSSRSSNPSGRFLPRFSFRPGNMSFRLSRANSLGSARSLFASSQRFAISTDEGELPRSSSSGRFTNRNERPQSCDFFPSCFSNQSPSRCSEDVTSNHLAFTPSTANFPDNFMDEPHMASRRGLSGDINDTRVECSVNLYSPRNHNYTDGFETRVSDRRSAAREPTERNISISRTLSVGRLRDRVVRRSSFPDVCSFQRETVTRHASDNSVRQHLGGELSLTASEGNDLNLSNTSGLSSSGTSTSLYGSQYYAVESPRGREARYSGMLEHRSNWLERRRRIRSQVYALQRLGRRFENHSGHERSCVLSGQHRTGHCTCHIGTRGANLDSDSSARASISRIVMLAEALFEVLDEIHQQSVVLSSQPSVSSIGSVPAPNEVVESLPVKSYNKFRRSSNDEVAQCYICLVEYEEGDILRTLPCHHEFHRTCVDKWLKEIHRVCPLCRGDICQSESFQGNV
ncbi:uncharacterized protein LOC107774361 [Nicotiana tabacum]|uniref:uncharacterized protein LOC107774361 n=1 Tax=Nicotiana tabacum TaxID=4097 RepID=UPI003F4EE825